MYTVKQLSDLTAVSVRTLHYYDEIGLLPPTTVGQNGYRYYDDDALLRLQQILFYREMGLSLKQIREIVTRPDFDLVAALREHRAMLEAKIERLQTLIGTVDSTMKHLTGEADMNRKQLFAGFSEAKQKHYEHVIRLEYGPEKVEESTQRWNGYTPAERAAIREEGEQIYGELVDAIEAGQAPQSEAVQAILARWHDNIRYFYEPTLDILRGLGEMYRTHPDFVANFEKLHPDLPEYLAEAVAEYVDGLETAELMHMLAEDDAAKRASP